MGRFRVAAIVVLLLTASLAGCTGLSPPPAGSEDNETTTPEGSGSDETTENSDDGPSTSASGTLEVHYIAVGQAASVLVISPGRETMLIDTGHFNDDSEHVIIH